MRSNPQELAERDVGNGDAHQRQVDGRLEGAVAVAVQHAHGPGDVRIVDIVTSAGGAWGGVVSLDSNGDVEVAIRVDVANRDVQRAFIVEVVSPIRPD